MVPWSILVSTVVPVGSSRSTRGQGLTEYALIIALVAIVAVAALTLLGGQIGTIFGDINTQLGG